jgi:ribosomal-protein-alanine N-acetyltransferase
MNPVLFDSGDDPGLLTALHASAFADVWTTQAFRDLLATPGTFAIHLQEGFILIRVAGDEAEILTLAVKPEARGRGVGRALLRAAADHAARLGAVRLFLEVGADNPAALALYAGQGFSRVGQRKGYYDGRDALILRAELPLSQSGEFA